MFRSIMLTDVLIVTGEGMGESVELVAVKDAYICDCQPDVTNPNGGPDYLYHGQYGNCFDRTLIQWDLSTIPSGASIESATMRLYCEAFYGTRTGEPVYYMITADWDESDVTYSTQPTYDTGTSVTGTWPYPDTWYEVDVTPFVQAWLDGTHVNHGIYCFAQNTAGTCVPGFWSKDYSDQSLRPRLVVEFTPEGFEQVTWGELKAEE